MSDTIHISANEIREAARGLLAAQVGGGARGEALWSAMLDAGWLALGVSEQFGGLGQPFSLATALLEELGRKPSAQPLIAAMAGTRMLDLLAAAGHSIARDLLGEALAGRAVVVCGPLNAAAQAVTMGDIAHAAVATHLVLAANCPERGELVLLLDLRHPAVHVESLAGWDATRQMAAVTLSAPLVDAAMVIETGFQPGRIAASGAALLDLGIASDSLGGAQQVLELTVAYMKQRIQFGRPIATFQALKHRSADLATELAAARALLARACAAYDADSPAATQLAAMARLAAGTTYLTVSEEAIQMHGGIGFTWEHVCHHYLKRARSAETIGGTRAERIDRVADALLREIRVCA